MTIEDSSKLYGPEDSSFDFAGNFDFGTLTSQRLVQFEDGLVQSMTEWEKIQAWASGLKFFDITETPNLGTVSGLRRKHVYPEISSADEKVTKVIKTLSTDLPSRILEEFTSFYTRYYTSKTGHDSALWLASKIAEVTEANAPKGLRERITQTTFPHSWGQQSIIVRINGSSPTDDGVIIMSSHIDSANFVPWMRAPGADDDGSGTVTILEAYRALLAADFHPLENVEFHWYSAEEAGLLGSQAVAHAYEVQGVNVLAQIQFDMTAWIMKGTREEFGIIKDQWIDESLTEFNKKLVETYLDIPWVETTCGYACSDHAPWNKAKYPSSFVAEGTFENWNRANAHRAYDAIDISDEFSWSHLLQFSKMAVAWAIELGGWETST
ncbi:peptidase [Stereum hirsutum FP-91666 SS1]|uniref:peptidase n=1 Tax=Stereum hirsutum (strain FP-91666) TaxID=721885 RepID=UPI00044105DC|nr:peptidase [Stereum hirsutum FP-91666 SS1]EIM91035.1 peptidase [Stereum hirsutum FP-91666 SS1]